MACQRCNSDRIVDISSKCSDLCIASLKWIPREETDGYVPDNLNIGGGDYVEFTYCADCGHLQGEWPLPQELTIKEDEGEDEV